MVARASLATDCCVDRMGKTVSRVRVLRSHGPLVLRPTKPKDHEPLVRQAGDAARVSMASGAAGPLGGDDFALNIRVGAGSTLLLNEISATLLLPGARGGRSHMRIAVTVEDDAAFVWMPEPVIAAHGCDHVHDIDITLGPGARLFMRDELLLGRRNEQPGNLVQNLRVRAGGKPLLHQQLRFGPAARGWRSPAVLGKHKCIGSVLVVDPQWCNGPPGATVFSNDAALLPLDGPAVMISALAADTLALRRLLDCGVDLLGEPWAVDPAPGQLSNMPGASQARFVERQKIIAA